MSYTLSRVIVESGDALPVDTAGLHSPAVGRKFEDGISGDLDKLHLNHEISSANTKFKKLLVANRGEIAIRIFRACAELGIRSCAIYCAEDSFAQHRFTADEAHQVGKGKTALRAYLDIPDIMRVCKENNVDAIHPGYGFLSENADFVKACKENGIVFVGPTEEVIRSLGDKVAARTIAIAAGVPVIPGTDNCESAQAAEAFCSEHGFPVLLKAAYGGGGRGMRVVHKMAELAPQFDSATREAENAFGNGTIFIERYLLEPRHIEVQLLGDSHGNLIHMFERDCSVQRRHQKVVEMAPCPNLDQSIREALLADALKIARHVNYTNAGTAEFLVDASGKHFFIEVNPRIQVEHTVTEQVTNIDIVKSQICIAAGCTLASLRLSQESIACNGVAIQVRVTTEDPQQGFKPSTGRLEVYRTVGGPGVRLDSSVTQGSVITPHFDSLLTKLTVSSRFYDDAVSRLVRSLCEFRIRGVTTNVAFLMKILTHPTFLANNVRTTFVDNTPELFDFSPGKDRTTRLLQYLSNLVVNGTELKVELMPPKYVPLLPDLEAIPQHPFEGYKKLLDTEGAEAFAKAVRAHKGALLTDTTWRDAHQSLLATRIRTIDLAAIAPATRRVLAPCYSLEAWGGATFDVCLRFLHEDPWKRLRQLRKLVPNIPLQMLLRGSNAVGYTAYPDNVVVSFIEQAKLHGVDIFRVFDSLNYVPNLVVAINAIKKCGGVVEAVVCYSGNVLDKDGKYSKEYYLNKAQELVDLGIHVLCIKDMAGLLKPHAGTMLVGALREKFPDLPIHVHTHDTAGTGIATYMACLNAGADVVDCCTDAMSGLTSQPSIGGLVGSLADTPQDTGLNPAHLTELNNYWEVARTIYAPFESPGLKSGNSDVYMHQMPGGQYTNLQFQANSLGLTGRWPAIKKAYAAASLLCGDIIKVTPSSKMVGDFAQFMIANDLDTQAVVAQAGSLDFPESVIKYFQGYLGQPEGGFPEQLRKDIVREREMITERPGKSIPDLDLDALLVELQKKYPEVTDLAYTDAVSAALYPKVFADHMAFRIQYGDLSWVPTPTFFRPMENSEELEIPFEQEKDYHIRLLATGRLLSDGNREVFWEINGSTRMMVVEDKTVDAGELGPQRAKADPANPGSIGSSMTGVVVELRVTAGQEVKVGDSLLILSAMKMETIVSAPVAGKVAEISVAEQDNVQSGDLLVTIV